MALYEKRLVTIVEYLVANASSYYEKDSVVADNDYGCTLSSLLAGLSALEFTKAKRADYCWTDPHVDGLVTKKAAKVKRSREYIIKRFYRYNVIALVKAGDRPWRHHDRL